MKKEPATLLVSLGTLAAVALAGGYMVWSSNVQMRELKGAIERAHERQDKLERQMAAMARALGGRQVPASTVTISGEDLVGDGAASMGAATAKVTLIEFSDYQCPFCGRHSASTLPRLIENYVDTGKIRYIVKDLPLQSLHPAAFDAAAAARCAGEQDRYWAMHDRFFENQRDLALADWRGHAAAVGLNLDAFEACMASGRQHEAVQADLELARRANIRGTPTFVLTVDDSEADGGRRVVDIIQGALPYRAFEKAIEDALATAKRAEG